MHKPLRGAVGGTDRATQSHQIHFFARRVVGDTRHVGASMTHTQDGEQPGKPYIVRWKRGSTMWTIRWLMPNGAYFAEYVVHEPVYLGPIRMFAGHAGNSSGHISRSDYTQIVTLVDRIRQAAPLPVSDEREWTGLLGDGSYGGGDIIFKYFGNMPPSSADDAFLQIVALLEKHIKPVRSSWQVIASSYRWRVITACKRLWRLVGGSS